MERRLWSHEEVLLALNLYFTLPFGQYHQHNPQVIQLAQLIRRTPSAVAMKLGNLASLDPNQQQRGIQGLPNASRADRRAWTEFSQHWQETAISTEEILQQNGIIAEQPELDRITETERTIKVRLGQSFFRKVVLANYRERCCICNLPLPKLLIASHIIAWNEREDLRLEPTNGLCLCALHDKAFDTGIIGITPDCTVEVNPVVSASEPNRAIEENFIRYQGHQLIYPDVYKPNPDYLSVRYERFLAAS